MNIWSSEIKEISQIYQSVKGKLPQLEKELGRLVTTDDENMLLVYSRRCLEVIITDLCEKELKRHRGTEPLQRIIDKLNKEEIVSHNIIVSMQNVNSMSTFGAHPKEFELQQVKPVLLNLKSILGWYLKYRQYQGTILDKSRIQQEKTKESADLLIRSPKPAKRKVLVVSVLLATTIIAASILFNITGKFRFTKTGNIDSIVVLPFDDFTGQGIPEHWINGMHALLIGDLQQIGNLFVPCPTTSRAIKNPDKTINQITSELHVDAALETSILSLGDNINIHVNLVEGKNETTIWQDDFKEDKNNALNLNNNITRKIAEEINIELTPAQERILSTSRPVDKIVLDDYLKGYNYLVDLRLDSLLQAQDYLNSAIEKDPDWAPPYVALAQILGWLEGLGYEKPEIVDPKIYKNINKALELDPDLADAHGAMGGIAMKEWNWGKAENEFKKALETNPNDALSRIMYSILLYVLQRPEEANIQADLGYKLDPLNPYIQSCYANTLLCRRDYTAAMSFLENLLSSDPDNLINNSMMENAAFANGNLMRMFEADKKFLPNQYPLIKEDMDKIEKIFNEKGYFAANDEIIRQMEIIAKTKYVNNFEFAFRYYFSNKDDKVIELLEQAVEKHEANLQYIGTGFCNFSRLYDNPRFIAICEKMNLPIPKSK